MKNFEKTWSQGMMDTPWMHTEIELMFTSGVYS